MLSLLQSIFPAVPLTADIVEGSSELTHNFKGTDDSKHHVAKFSHQLGF